MCGIVGYAGNRSAYEILIRGLRRLEYRGYDSAGLAVLDDSQLRTLKTEGKIDRLVERVEAEWDESLRNRPTCGIAHTRWATHGAPSEANAHPHFDQSGQLAVVHNGIIENYLDLRRELTAQGHTFVSETDTEVMAHLIGSLYHGDLLQAVCAALPRIEGTLGLAAIAANAPGGIVVARRGSPLAVGLGAGETIVASDAGAISAFTRQVIYLDDNDVASVTAAGADIRTVHNVPVSRAVAQVEGDAQSAGKGGFPHYMLKEIYEQPDALRNTLRGRLDEKTGSAILSGLGFGPRETAAVRRVVIVGCGTSLYAGMTGRYFFEKLADVPTDTEQAAEFRYRNPILDCESLVLAMSQSGETADTLAAVREATQKGALVAGICNVVGSSIAREAGRGIYLHAGPEIGVASTKAYSCQVAALLMLALKLGRSRRLSRATGLEIIRALLDLPRAVEDVLALNDRIAAIAGDYAGMRDCFYIGRGCLFPVAMEGALKIKEISYVHAEGYHAAELKHGPIALLDKTVPVVALLNDVPGRDKMIGNVQECRARGAPVIGVVTAGDSGTGELADHIIAVPRTHALTAPVATAVALQLLAYHVARLRGCPIDQPRNLAKSVTVE